MLIGLAALTVACEPAGHAGDAASADSAVETADASIDAEPDADVVSVLRPSTDLTPNCFDSPAEPFGPDNCTPDSFSFLEQGQPAIDFALKQVDGADFTLSQALLDAPVLLITGSYTCPVYRDLAIPRVETLAEDYRGRIQVVHVYTVEAHPQDPEPSAYRGEPWPLDYSDRSDPKTYAERLANAEALVSADPRVTTFDQTLVIDDLTPGAQNNPFWCSWGTCANCAFLVDRDGRLALVMDWFQMGPTVTAIESLLDGS